MNMMTYKTFKASVTFEEDDDLFVGRLLGINDVVGFHADSVEGLKSAFHEAVEDYLETCAAIGKEPEKAFSGNMMLRVDPQTHSNAAMAAELAGKSLNQWSEWALSTMASRAIGEKAVPGKQS